MDESPYIDGWRLLRINLKTTTATDTEILDAETIKAKYAEQRIQVLKADGNTAQISVPSSQQKKSKKKTKALTTDSAKLRDYNKIVIYCPTCQGTGTTRRMLPYKLGELLSNPDAYTELVGGLPFEDDTIFLHCSYCDLRLIPSIDEAEKLDARTEDEYEISSLADITKKNKPPVIAGQSNRYNKAKKQKEEIYQRRKKMVQEQLNTDYERKSKGAKPSE